MTRFNISLDEAVDMVLFAMENCAGGEILVPKIPSYDVVDLATAVCADCQHDLVGIRPGEKIHEELISVADSYNTIDLGKYFAILPVVPSRSIKEKYGVNRSEKKIESGHSYNSGNNLDRLGVKELAALIQPFRNYLG
jgi:UDP-N-acetylglucosamine 4,6-dehydratase/5-epimerase